MGRNAIEYQNGQFASPNCTMSPTELVRVTLEALIRGEEMNRMGVTANYVVQMLRIVGKTGEFVDFTQGRMGDHEFDANTPTPGSNWAEAREAKNVVKLLSQLFGRVLWFAPHLDSFGEMEFGREKNTRQTQQQFQLPLLKAGCSNVDDDEIRYHAGSQSFHFGQYQVSLKKLASLIANTLMVGDEWVQIGDFSVTVNYLEGMVRVAGKYGEYCDYDDADFDPNVAAKPSDFSDEE